MISDISAYNDFVAEHRWAVLTHLKRDGAPASSVVAYAVDGDTLVVSTPGYTIKRRALNRDPRANLCIISNQEPFNFVSLGCRVTVETEALEVATSKVFDNIEAVGYPAPEDLSQWLIDGKRVILRLQPETIHGVIR
ncbi:MAG: pyridoxamine 5'-phosphate oxidase family protein [Pseudomonadales bacterium]|jgi:PPOX class probable F420-dependent enzyme|nr:pyridoxamine 5'-phosphate oxidase family protein [Pseudomonadales bacterium]MDA0760548.1 pyridoxamine 5'-phosphate oxidase family protein [Pseudomonadota bacterium]MDA0958453.1 pyridoxamine 5'-phosphate oxidase family protein [Pseudomonadota bacterium]MDA1206932.1 pyridoxamine 5'-phosphate oxidase family protein [Pseudomonadota bacterium]